VVRDIESIILELGSAAIWVVRVDRGIGVCIKGKLEYFSPRDSQHGVGFVSIAGTQTLAPIQIGDCPLLYIIWFINEK
jgi:hypothetical protein